MRLYRVKRTQFLPVSMGTAWQFFSDPINLPEITPPWVSECWGIWCSVSLYRQDWKIFLTFGMIN